MDMDKIKNLMDENNFAPENYNDSDLEDELEAILSGRPIAKKNKPAAAVPSRAQKVKPAPTSSQVAQASSQRSANQYKNVGTKAKPKAIDDDDEGMPNTKMDLNTFCSFFPLSIRHK